MTRAVDTEIRRQCDRIDRLCRQVLESSGSAGPIQIMEVCGTHTMCIARSGLAGLLPDDLKLISGPGCPVCVTDQSYIDRAMHLALECKHWRWVSRPPHQAPRWRSCEHAVKTCLTSA